MARHGSRKTTSRVERDRPTARTATQDQPLAALTRAAGSMVRAGGDVQQHIAQSSGLLQQEAARKLRLATNPGEFFAVQAAFMLASWQQSVECSSIVAQAWRDAIGTRPTAH